MSDYKMHLKDNNGKDCSVEDFRAFQKHLKLYHSKGASVHDENGHYFAVDDEFLKKINQMVIWLFQIMTFSAG